MRTKETQQGGENGFNTVRFSENENYVEATLCHKRQQQIFSLSFCQLESEIEGCVP